MKRITSHASFPDSFPDSSRNTSSSEVSVNVASEDLFYVAEDGDLQGIQNALQNGAEINSFHRHGVGSVLQNMKFMHEYWFTPLMIAAYQKQKETVEYLLVKGADPTLRSRGCGQGAAGPFASLNAAQIASFVGNYPITVTIKRASEKKAIREQEKRKKAQRKEFEKARQKQEEEQRIFQAEKKKENDLFSACRQGDLDLVKAIVNEKKSRALIEDHNGNLPVHLAASSGHVDIIKFLVTEFPNRGVDTCRTEQSERTPLHEAAHFGHLKATEFLINQLNADPNSRTIDGDTPLTLACRNGKLDVAEFLVTRGGADISAKNRKGENCLQILNKDGNWKIASTFKEIAEKGSLKKAIESELNRWREEESQRKKYAYNIFIFQKVEMENAIMMSEIERVRQSAFAAERLETLQRDPMATFWLKEEQKRNLFDDLNDTYFSRKLLKKSPQHEALDSDVIVEQGEEKDDDDFPLYCALMYATLLTCTEEDVFDELQVYETRKRELLKKNPSKIISVNPLLLLAHARLAKKQSPILELGLLREFHLLSEKQRKEQDEPVHLLSEWLTDGEKEKLNVGCLSELSPFSSELLLDSQDPKKGEEEEEEEEELERRGGEESIERKWKKLVKQANLSQDKQKPMDQLLRLIGLSQVKEVAFSLYTDVLADQRLREAGFSSSAVCTKPLNFVFEGNPGIGKTESARLFASLLEQSGARPGHKFIQMTASAALRKGARAFASEISSLTGGQPGVGPPPSYIIRRGMAVEVKNSAAGKSHWYPGTISAVQEISRNSFLYEVAYADGTVEVSVTRDRIKARGEGHNVVGGVLFLDEAYDLDPAHNPEGRTIVNEIMNVAEDHRDQVTIILAGYKDEIQRKLYSFNPGMPSRFVSVPFEDFDEDQLALVWEKFCRDGRWQTSREVTRVAARRVARGIGSKGFANARSVRQLFDTAVSSAKRSFFEGEIPTIKVTDVIGLPPTRENIPELHTALNELDQMIGLGAVKKTVEQMVDLASSNYERELAAEPIDLIPLNRLFLGNPGTGKTSVARVYGKILKSLRLLSNGDLIFKTASDLIGTVVGESQQKTLSVLEMAKGRVLFIDEAYNLDDDLYGKQCLDTIVEKLTGAPGEDIAVIMAGYKPQMLKMVQEQNPGLTRRFDPTFAVHFEDFSDGELLEILSLECSRRGVRAPRNVKLYAVRLLSRRRVLANFGNAAAVKTLISNAIERLASRERRQLNQKGRAGKRGQDLRRRSVGGRILMIEDVDPDFAVQGSDPEKALEELRGCETIERELRDLGSIVAIRQHEGRSTEGLVGHYVFTGSPGTGKSTAARAMGRVLFSYGLIAKKDVVESSAPDLIGSFVGHSRKNMEDRMKSAKGGVLLIDEAYKLGDGGFGEEALVQLLTMLTLPDYSNGKTVVVLAGYEKEMHMMLERNPGMKSRFMKFVSFSDWGEKMCVELVEKYLWSTEKLISFQFEERDEIIEQLKKCFEELRRRPGWGNARDAINLAKAILWHRDVRMMQTIKGNKVPQVLDQGVSKIECGDVESAIAELVASRPRLGQSGSNWQQGLKREEEEQLELQKRDQGKKNCKHEQKKIEKKVEEESRCERDGKYEEEDDERELDIFQKEKGEIDEASRKIKEDLKEIERGIEDAQKRENEIESWQELKEVERGLKEKEKEIEKKKKDIEVKEKKRQEIKKKLQTIGNCVQGYRWKFNGREFQCGGGTHFVSLDQLEITEEDAQFF